MLSELTGVSQSAINRALDPKARIWTTTMRRLRQACEVIVTPGAMMPKQEPREHDESQPKMCDTCHETLPKGEFWHKWSSPDLHWGTCKRCYSALHPKDGKGRMLKGKELVIPLQQLDLETRRVIGQAAPLVITAVGYSHLNPVPGRFENEAVEAKAQVAPDQDPGVVLLQLRAWVDAQLRDHVTGRIWKTPRPGYE